MATNTLILRSRDRVDGESHHFRLQLAHPLEGCWALEYASIPNGHFTVTATNNALRVATGRDPSFTPQRGISYEAPDSPPQAPKFLRTHLDIAPQARKFWA